MIVISLFDYTGEAVKPWAEAGYTCFCYDVQHKGYADISRKGTIYYENWDANEGIAGLLRFHNDSPVKFVFGWPPCDDLAVSGAAHFKSKLEKDPDCQNRAVRWARLVEELANHFGVPWVVENPVSVLSTKWRKPDHLFNPYEYGGYLPSDDVHPKWPDYIAPRDAYPKKTCYWTGNGFKMPPANPVTPVPGYSKQHLKLGGRSLKTKNIRSATPRGIARAIFETNSGATNDPEC